MSYRLELPKSASSRQAVAQHIGRHVVATGMLHVSLDEPQKDGAHKTELTFHVMTLQEEESGKSILNQSADRRWLAVVKDNGLELIDRSTGKRQQVFEPMPPLQPTQIDWTIRTTFDGKLFSATRGLESKTLRLADSRWLAKPKIDWTELRGTVKGLSRVDEENVKQLFRGYSPNARYAVYNIHLHGKLPSAVLFADTKNGKVISVLPFDVGGNASVSYTNDEKVALVQVRGTTKVVNLSNGKVTIVP